jgi:hypothetical protein
MSDYLNQMRNYLESLRGSDVPRDKTHMMELFTLMKDGLSDLALLEGLNYDSGSLIAKVKFADGKTYVVEIRPHG